MEPGSNEITIENLVSTGAHFGHLTRRWHPHYKPFIYTAKNGIHIIDVQQTIDRLHKAVDAIGEIVKKGGAVLFVGTKKQAKDVLQREADRCSMYYVVERWLGGTLTNFSTIKRSIKRLQQLEKDADTLYESLTKKEILMMERERIRLSDQHRGIKDMKQLPSALFIVDVNHEMTAVLEAKRLEIPVFAIVDSNADPRPIDFPIPANDDSLRAVQLITAAFADGIIAARGGKTFEDDTVETVAEDQPHKPAKVTEKKPAVAASAKAEPEEAGKAAEEKKSAGAVAVAVKEEPKNEAKATKVEKPA
ncbi:MAG: 30S ribosomal protein S2 [Candidatus Marinimicrobia bacterium]|nr:30S ribosomal protein S2 [Candidatus Neomarinimicrobiota bacterium]